MIPLDKPAVKSHCVTTQVVRYLDTFCSATCKMDFPQDLKCSHVGSALTHNSSD